MREALDLTEKNRVGEDLFMLRDIYMKGNLIMIILMVMEELFIKMDLYMKDYGKIICNMETENLKVLMD
jgi:hypothetical protein